MRLFTPLRPNPTAPLARANPLAKLLAAVILMAILFLSIDPVTPLIVLAGLAAALPFTGLPARALLQRTWPIPLAALAVGILNVVFAAERGGAEIALGPWRLAADSLVAGVALALRLMAIALSGVLALVTTDPTDLADALVQHARVPPRFAVGALAAARLMPVLARDWQTLALARRARGVSSNGSPLMALRLAFARLLAMLVSAIRAGTRLATAMESRGFGSRPCRTLARPRDFGARDWTLVAGAVVLALGAVGAAVALGTWRFLFA